MDITFQKRSGDPSLGIEFFWVVEIRSDKPFETCETFIPELYYDCFVIKEGNVRVYDPSRKIGFTLPRQAFKTLFTHPVELAFSTPLVLMGARFSLKFAEHYCGEDLPPNSFCESGWVRDDLQDLGTFAAHVAEYVRENRTRRNPYLMLKETLEESDWLKNYSPRQKRRYYKSAFGVSRKELDSLRGLHTFLAQSCSFEGRNPRLIEHINPEAFYDQPHFNHTFKKLTGLTPLEFFERNSILQDNLMSATYNEILEEKDKI
jgi:hypothetical protein